MGDNPDGHAGTNQRHRAHSTIASVCKYCAVEAVDFSTWCQAFSIGWTQSRRMVGVGLCRCHRVRRCGKGVRARGAAMQKAVPANVGAMAAVIGLDDEAIRQVCIASVGDGIVEAVNYNAPGQVVIAGTAEAIDRAVKACKVAGAKRALPLPVSAPFHTSLMRPAADAIAPLVEELSLSNPIVPIVHNVTACVEVDGEAIKELMLEQIYKPVPWVSCVLALKSAGITDVVECGPGRVLSGLIKRIAADLTCYTTDSVISMNESLVSV